MDECRQTNTYIDRQSYLRSTSQTQLSVISFTPCIHLPMWGQSKTVLSTGVASQLLNDYPACGKGGDNNRCDHTLCPANAKTAIGSVSCCIDLCDRVCVCVCVTLWLYSFLVSTLSTQLLKPLPLRILQLPMQKSVSSISGPH